MVTQAQLNNVIGVCNQLSIVLAQIIKLATIARDAQIAGAALDQITIDNLLAQYTVLKTQLQTIFGTLP